MVRSLAVALAVLAVPAAASPSLLGPRDVTHGLHLLAIAPPTAGLPPNPTRPQVAAQLVRVQQELDELPSRAPGLALLIAGFATTAVGLVTALFAGTLALFGGSVAAAIALAGLVGAGLGLIAGIAGVILLATANAVRNEPEARLSAEQTYLQRLLELYDRAPPAQPSAPPPGVEWLPQPRPAVVLAAF